MNKPAKKKREQRRKTMGKPNFSRSSLLSLSWRSFKFFELVCLLSFGFFQFTGELRAASALRPSSLFIFRLRLS